MAKHPRPKPERLPEKLKAIRASLNYSQGEMLLALGLRGNEDSLNYARSYDRSIISGYELGTKEPPLPILLKYARLARISTDVLIDDELNLPHK